MGWNGKHPRRNLHCSDCAVEISYTSKGKCKSCARKGVKPWNTGKSLSPEHVEKIKMATVPHRFKIGHTTNYGRKPWNAGLGNDHLNHKVRATGLFKFWRRAVIEMASGVCVVCQQPGKLEAHHIIAFNDLLVGFKINTIEEAKQCKLLWDIHNGIGLCQTCHNKTKSGRPKPSEHLSPKKQSSGKLVK